ncbi:expressed protein [Chlorella variabilis]|uniref:Expressed protein n=1 Tax=Chlorella variabilis TaxID=554065 RepID=E1ZRM9_CHLVA|nr:expressed protein [Chlorella variabilis]EFN51492.1 expressed protein [Chlorella variabilis]|eukprot:XP_005843594.1 expressed protein [Chlorella variabilis]
MNFVQPAPVDQVPDGLAVEPGQADQVLKQFVDRCVVDLAARAGGGAGLPNGQLFTDLVNTAGWAIGELEVAGRLTQGILQVVQPAVGPAVQQAMQQEGIQETVQQAAGPAVQQAVQQELPQVMQGIQQGLLALQQGQQFLLQAVQGLQQGQQGLQQGQQELQQGQQELQQGQQELRQGQQELQQGQQELRQMLVGAHNLAARVHNRDAREDGPLQPLRNDVHHPGAEFGALPAAGVFPPTTTALWIEWTHAQVDTLAEFYGVDFGQQGSMLLPNRKSLVKAFIKGP